MKKKAVYLLLGAVLTTTMLAGCKEKKTEEATAAVEESTETEEEGTGEATAETDAEEETEEEAEDSEETEASGDKKDEKEASDSDTSEDASESDQSEDTEETEEALEQVAVLLPDEEEWSIDAEELRSALEDDGYEAVMLYADDSSSTQVSQIREEAEAQVKAMIIAPVDTYGLADVLDEIEEMDIPVFSYDDLIMDTSNVNYFVTYGGRQIGQQIARAIVEKEELDKLQEQKESRTIEFIMGSTDDVQALFLYNGMMEILQPYLDDGTLVCTSGETAFDDTGILRWDEKAAKTRASKILKEFYSEDTAPDIICTGFDAAALAVTDVLEENGFDADGENWPLITGVGCEAEVVKAVASGKISMSVFLDSRTLADQCESMVNVLLHGEEDPEVNDYEQYDNGIKIIGTYLCEPQLIDADNYEILIDNGFYAEAEVRPDPTATPVPTETPTPEPTQEAEISVTPEADKDAKETETDEADAGEAEQSKARDETDEETAETPTPTEAGRTTLRRAS